MNGDLEKKLKKLKDWIEEKERGKGINWGGRVLMRGQGMKEKRWRKRRSWGRKEGRRIKKLMKKAENCRFLEEYGWSIVNGNIKGDEEEEWTFTGGREESIIDYVMRDEKTREKIEKMVVEGKVDSDHHP